MSIEMIASVILGVLVVAAMAAMLIPPGDRDWEAYIEEMYKDDDWMIPEWDYTPEKMEYEAHEEQVRQSEK